MEQLDDQEKFNKELSTIFKNEYLYKYLDFDGGLMMLENNNIQFTRADKLNDEYDCSSKLIDFQKHENLEPIFKQVIRFGVCSLSKSHDNLTLWSEKYAKSDGICIGLDTEILIRILSCQYKAQFPFIVDYCKDINKRIKLDILKKSKNIDVLDFLKIKDYNKWHTEKEIRFVTIVPMNRSEYIKRYQLPKECFQYVYLGNNITEEQMLKVKEVTKRNSLKVKIVLT